MIKKINKEEIMFYFKQFDIKHNFFLTEDNLKNNTFIEMIGYFDNNELVSFCIYEKIYERIEIDYIYIKEEYQKRNIASKLLNQLKDETENITLEVSINNTKAIKFYKKNGFKEIKKIKNYYTDSDGILMIWRDENETK